MKKILALGLLLLSIAADAENKITLFVPLTPAGSFNAVSNKAKGNVIKTGETFTADKISVNIESFKTGIDLRDEHTWKHMTSGGKHPKAILTEIRGEGGKATGNLELNGVKKPVSISYKVSGTEVAAKFSVKASDFGYPSKEYLGVGVGDVINVEALLPYKSK